MAAVYSTAELAELAGVSDWLIRDSVKNDNCPFEFIRIGHRIVFPKGPADRKLGLLEGAG